MYNTCYCHWFTYWLKELRCDDPNLSHWYLSGRLHVVSSLRLIDCRSRAKITPTFGVPATLLDRGWLPMTPVRQRTAYLRARRVAYRLIPPPNVHVEPIITWLSHGLWSGAVLCAGIVSVPSLVSSSYLNTVVVRSWGWCIFILFAHIVQGLVRELFAALQRSLFYKTLLLLAVYLLMKWQTRSLANSTTSRTFLVVVHISTVL